MPSPLFGPSGSAVAQLFQHFTRLKCQPSGRSASFSNSLAGGQTPEPCSGPGEFRVAGAGEALVVAAVAEDAVAGAEDVAAGADDVAAGADDAVEPQAVSPSRTATAGRAS